MSRILLLPVMMLTAFGIPSASAAFRPYLSISLAQPRDSLIRVRSAGRPFRALPQRRQSVSRQYISSSQGRAALRSGPASGQSSPHAPSFAVRQVWNAGVPSHMQSHFRAAPLHAGAGASLNGHPLIYKVLGYRHSMIAGVRFKRPGAHLPGRLAKIRGHRWHEPYRRVAIVDFAGAIACDLDCEFDVPDNVYGDFVAAASEDQSGDSEAALPAEEDAALANVPPAEAARRRIAGTHGWNKAAAILERAAADDDNKAAEARGTGSEAGAAINQPDERVDLLVEGGAAKKGNYIRA